MTAFRYEPLRRYGFPSYPTKLQSLADPDLLRRYMPPAWLGRAELAAAAGAFLSVTVAGCTDRAIIGSAGQPARVAPVYQCPENVAKVVQAVEEAKVVEFSCVVMTPPSFLSEQDALVIIKEEAARQGVSFPEHELRLDSVLVRYGFMEERYEWVSGAHDLDFREELLPVRLELADRHRKIGVAYVSDESYTRNRAWLFNGGSVKAKATNLSSSVAKQGKDIYFGALYDPSDDVYEEIEKARNAGKQIEGQAEARRLLRQQVKDFSDWLKAQGVI